MGQREHRRVRVLQAIIGRVLGSPEGAHLRRHPRLFEHQPRRHIKRQRRVGRQLLDDARVEAAAVAKVLLYGAAGALRAEALVGGLDVLKLLFCAAGVRVR